MLSIQPPRKRGDGAVGSADDQHQHRGDQTDRQADAGAHHDTHGKVTAHAVGAENVRKDLLARVDELLLGGRILERSKVVAALDLQLIAVGPQGRQNIGHERDEQNDDQTDHGDFVFAQAAHTVLPEVDALAHDDKALFFSSLDAGAKSSTLSCRLNGFFQIFHFVCSSLLQLDCAGR